MQNNLNILQPQPVLSICIPTFCRAHNLDKCLAAITIQFDKKPKLISKVEIIISDNASTDNTRLVVEKYIKKYNNIKYFVNENNLGADENYINSVINSSGKFSWIIGDDDFVLGNTLNCLVNFLEKNDVIIYTIETETFVNMQTVLQERECSNNVEFFSAKSFNDFFERGFCIGLLSSIIFNRKAWLDVDREEYLPGWSYYEIALKMIARSTLPLAHIRFPMIATLESCDWVKNGTEFFYFINWKNILERLPNFGYNVGYVNLCLSKFPKKLIIILLRAKGNGLKTTKNNLFRLCKEFYKSPFYLVLALIIFIIPNFIIKSVRDIRKKINDIKI